MAMNRATTNQAVGVPANTTPTTNQNAATPGGTNSLAPGWFRTPLAQTITLGLVFFFVFSSYTTIQFYARTTYGPQLSADCVSCIYFTFTGACLCAPAVVNQCGDCRRILFYGVLGYAALVAASLVYFVYGVKFIVILGGAILGIGAALLWTGQGRLILDYAAIAPEQSGRIMGTFWAVFQCSAIVGGCITFLFYSESPTGGSIWLYLIFLGFILIGAISTQLLLSPDDLVVPMGQQQRHQPIPQSETTSLSDDSKEFLGSTIHDDDTPSVEAEEDEVANMSGVTKTHVHPSSSSSAVNATTKDCNLTSFSTLSWYQEARDTLALFRTKPMVMLSCLFFYTGFNQPYQQATFSNRFFSKRTIGLEMIIFHIFEIIGALVIGRTLDFPGIGRRQSAKTCLVVFVVVNTLGNILAWYKECQVMVLPTQEEEDGTGTTTTANVVLAVDITDTKSIVPSLSLALWGFADALIQVYVYWVLGIWYESGDNHARAVGFYKCIQSLGVSIGFALTPLSRLSAIGQLTLSSTIYVIGTTLAFFQLPPLHC